MTNIINRFILIRSTVNNQKPFLWRWIKIALPTRKQASTWPSSHKGGKQPAAIQSLNIINIMPVALLLNPCKDLNLHAINTDCSSPKMSPVHSERCRQTLLQTSWTPHTFWKNGRWLVLVNTEWIISHKYVNSVDKYVLKKLNLIQTLSSSCAEHKRDRKSSCKVVQNLTPVSKLQHVVCCVGYWLTMLF